MSDSEGVSRRGFLRAATAGTAATAAGTGAAAAQEGTTGGEGTTSGNGTGGNATTTGGGGGGGGQTVTVSVSTEGNDYVFKPGTSEPLYIKPGTTVEFTWKGNQQHNIVVDSQPDGADWQGHDPLESAPFTYKHTFETLGTYDYYCRPHRSLGMVGSIVVNESGQNPSGGGYQTILPDSATTLGVAATGASISVLALAYFFMKYGGEYGDLTDEA